MNARARRRSTRVDGCSQCGQAHRQKNGSPGCIAHRTGKPNVPCTKAPIKGAQVCTAHGGSLTKTKAKAQQRWALMQAEGEIGDLMRMCDIPEQHPIDGLLECVRVAGAMTRVLTVKVSELQSDPTIHTYVTTDDKGKEHTTKIAGEDGFYGVDHLGDMAQHVYVVMLKQWQDAYARACKMALDAGIDERRIRMAEATGDGLFEAVGEALAAVPGLTAAQRQSFSLALAASLRARAGVPALEA